MLARVCFSSVGVWRVLKRQRTSNGWSGETDHSMKGEEWVRGSETSQNTVWSCCSSLYVIISAELSKREEQRNSGGLHSGVKGTEEELQNDGMGVRTSATKGKSESVLSWKLAWMWRTNKNKSVYLKGTTGEGGHLKRNYIILVNLGVLSVRGLIAAVIWPCDPAVIPPHHLFSCPSSASQVPSFH